MSTKINKSYGAEVPASVGKVTINTYPIQGYVPENGTQDIYLSVVGKHSGSACAWLTPEQARQIANYLLRAADVAEVRGEQ